MNIFKNYKIYYYLFDNFKKNIYIRDFELNIFICLLYLNCKFILLRDINYHQKLKLLNFMGILHKYH
jgi:hypothetical protein